MSDELSNDRLILKGFLYLNPIVEELYNNIYIEFENEFLPCGIFSSDGNENIALFNKAVSESYRRVGAILAVIEALDDLQRAIENYMIDRMNELASYIKDVSYAFKITQPEIDKYSRRAMQNKVLPYYA